MHCGLQKLGCSTGKAAILLLAVALSPASSQAEGDPFRRHFLLQVWETDHGLPQNSALSVAQTPDGYLWVGTFGGLARFDGDRFTVFDKGNTPEFPSDAVVRLFADRGDRLWASMEGGLAFLQDGRWRVVLRSEGGFTTLARSFVEDREGTLFVSGGPRIARFVNGQFIDLPVPEAPAKPPYMCVADAQGTLWVSSGPYFGRFDRGRWVKVEIPRDPGNANFDGLATSRRGGVWLADKEHLREIRDGVVTRELDRPAWLPPGIPLSILEDSGGCVWLGHFYKGAAVFLPQGDALRCGREQGLKHDQVRCVFEDREGNIWLGTDGGGLARVKRRACVVLDEQEGLQEPIIAAVAEEKPGQLLVGSYGGGVVRLDASRMILSPPIQDTNAKLHAEALVLSLLPDKTSAVWVATYDNGLFRIQGDTVQRVPSEQAGRRITALHLGGSGLLWMGADFGVTRYDGNRFSRYGTNAGLPMRRVMALAEDRNTNLWVGTTHGLFHQQGGRFERVALGGAPESQRITSLYPDGQGVLWIGTLDRGLARWQDGRLFEYTAARGLSVSSVVAILEDDLGYLWLASSREGAVRVSRVSLEAVAAGAQSQLDCVTFDKSDGLPTREFRYGTQPVAWKSSDGRLWFATLKGLAMIDPARVTVNTAAPPVRIEAATQDGQSLALNSTGSPVLDLPAGGKRLQIRYSALSFAAPEKVRFQYRLEGLDKDWINAGAHRVAEFSELSPGTYRFQVRATLTPGVWPGLGTSLRLVQLPFFWQTVWFQVLSVSLLAGFVGLVVWRIQQKRVAQEAERRRHQEILLTTEARYRALFESSSDGIFILEGEGEDKDRILSANPAAAVMHGYALDELAGRRIQELDAPSASFKVAGQALRPHECERLTLELEHRRKDGSVFPVEVTTNLMRVGNHLYILAIDRDLTERKKAEENRTRLETQLRQAQKLEALGTLAGGIAHDFNNILAGILGNIEMARMELRDGQPVENFLQEALKAAQRARDSVAQILTFSRRREPKRTLIQLWPVVEEALKLLRASLPATIEISTRIPSSSPSVLADASQVHQVMMNLGTNAAHAIGSNPGVLEVVQSVVVVDFDLARSCPQLREGRYVRLSVRDTGHGMDALTLAHIFEPFFTTKTTGEGTGLGLSVVHGIIQSHDGAITVESTPGQGSTFHLYFPAVAGPATELLRAPTSLRRGSGQHILFVDDEPGLVQLGTTLLQRLGYTVTAFTNPEEALKAFQISPDKFALTITDFAMPKMTGGELARRLREVRPGTPIILTTGYSATIDLEKARQLGFRDLVPKPFSLQAFSESVYRVLGEGNPKAG